MDKNHEGLEVTGKDTALLKDKKTNNSSTTKLSVSISEMFSFSTIYSAYSFQWMLLGTKVQTSDQMIGNQASIALLSALLLTIWFSLLYGDYNYQYDWENVLVGVCALLAIVCHFLAMVNSVILGMMFSGTKSEKSNAGKYLLETLGTNAIVPMIQLYLGCFFGAVAMFIIIFIEYLRVTFYSCTVLFCFFIFVVNGVYYQFNVVAYRKAIELDNLDIDIDYNTGTDNNIILAHKEP